MTLILFQNDSFLGCLPSFDQFHVDQANLIEAFKSVKKLRREKCLEICESLMHSVAVFTKKDSEQKLWDCSCLQSLWNTVAKVNETADPQDCFHAAYITPWAYSKCSHATFLDPRQTKIPQVCLFCKIRLFVLEKLKQ